MMAVNMKTRQASTVLTGLNQAVIVDYDLQVRMFPWVSDFIMPGNIESFVSMAVFRIFRPQWLHLSRASIIVRIFLNIDYSVHK